MSQSPLQRSARRPLQAFAHVPSRLSKQPSTADLADAAAESPSAGRASITTPSSSKSLSKSRASYVSAGTSTDASTSAHNASQDHTPKLPRSRTQGDFTTPARRDTPTRNGGSHTPIHYSPYALATPPPGMSKSASTPFDMAASAKAARMASERKTREEGSDVALVGRSERRKSRGFVRQKSMWQKVVDTPSNLVEKLSLNMPTSVDEFLPSDRYAHPITLGIHAIHFLCVASPWSLGRSERSILRSSPDRSVGGRWGQWEEEHKSKGWGVSLAVFTLLLVALSLANAVYLFTRFRTYDMQLRSAADVPSSPHASPIPAPKRTADDPFVDPSKKKEVATTEKILRISGRAIIAAVMSMLGRPTDKPVSPFGAEDRIQSLRVWDPPEFCLAFFCAYPPSAPVLAYLLTRSHTLLTIVLHLSSAMLLSHLSLNFRQLVKDRQILAAEVMKEYDKKFVYKKIFGGKVDRGVQTSQAEMIY